MPNNKFYINNIYDLIEKIKSRPAMYIGDNKISSFRSYIDGYSSALKIHGIKFESTFPPFWYFHEWVMQKYNWRESTTGWNNIILKENNYDDEKSLTIFFELFDEFKTLKPISAEQIKLTKKNISFYHKNCQMMDGNGNPIYENAEEIFLIKFSPNLGFYFFMIDKNKIQGTSWMERFKNEKLAKTHIETLFDVQNSWRVLNGDLKLVLDQAM